MVLLCFVLVISLYLISYSTSHKIYTWFCFALFVVISLYLIRYSISHKIYAWLCCVCFLMVISLYLISYSISRKIYTWFCCALICYGYDMSFSVFMWYIYTLTALCKWDVTPVRQHWSYISFALSHRHILQVVLLALGQSQCSAQPRTHNIATT